MNIIRTKAVELSSIPAIAYKVKLASGGSGIRLLRLDMDAVGAGTIEKANNEVTFYGKIDEKIFPYEAFEEAVELTLGLPYSARGKIKVTVFEVAEEEEIVEDTEEENLCMSGSEEYIALVNRYSDENGKMNYTLMNKDFIQFAAKSKIVSNMVASLDSVDEILIHIVKTRVDLLVSKKKNLSDKEVSALIELLEEIDTRSAFKELKAYIKRLCSKDKRNRY